MHAQLRIYVRLPICFKGASRQGVVLWGAGFGRFKGSSQGSGTVVHIGFGSFWSNFRSIPKGCGVDCLLLLDTAREVMEKGTRTHL